MEKYMCLLLFFLMIGNSYAGSFDDMMKADVKDDKVAVILTSKELFNKQIEFSRNNIYKKSNISLNYFYSAAACNDISDTYFPYPHSSKGELYNSIRSILKNEYGAKDNLDDGYLRYIVYSLGNICDLQSSKFTKEYLHKVKYDFSQDGFSQETRMDNRIKSSISGIKNNLKNIKESGEIESVGKLFDDYTTSLNSYFIDLEKYFDNTFQIYANENKELNIAYTAFINDPTIFPQQNIKCLQTVVRGMSSLPLPNKMTTSECSILELNLMGTQCDVTFILTAIEQHPVSTLKNIIPLNNQEIGGVISDVEPFRIAASELNKICVFTK